GFPMGSEPFFPGRPKVSRGDVRIAILRLLAEEPMHGYQIMQELTERSGGMWRPSPGSIYPTLQLLNDEDLIQADEHDGKKVYRLTPDGQALVDAAHEAPPWERFGAGHNDGLVGLRDVGFQVGAAVMEVGRSGTDAQIARAHQILEQTRKDIYRVLADDTEDETS
ncbi:MAG: PadR family transcriptional regulator, partial [Acidimicrobiia bacterium]